VSYSNPTTNPTGGAGDRRDLAQPALHDAPKEVCLGKDLVEAVLSPAVTVNPTAFVSAIRGRAKGSGVECRRTVVSRDAV
jgi:hypothetical protein